MLINPQVPLHRLILSLSEALDHVHPQVVDHQQRAAYAATNIARKLGFKGQDLINIFHAAALHDIGLIGVENRVKAVHLAQLERAAEHGEVGFVLLKDNPLLAEAAEILRDHHVSWADGNGAERNGRPVSLATHILVVADGIDRSISRSVSVLQQVDDIVRKVTDGSGKRFHPDCVDAVCDLAERESFWLDMTSQRIYSILLKQVDWPVMVIDEMSLQPIAKAFVRIVDVASQWTAVHSAGVAATAVGLAKRLRFSPRELHLMRAAGYLHDLGKLSVPNRILDKPGRLTANEMCVVRAHTYHTFRVLDTIGGLPQISEWAAFHHERLDGSGYPFHHDEQDLTLGARIMTVADVFTALTEDRPYRKGMPSQKVQSILNNLVHSNALDGDVVAALTDDYDAIDAARCTEQAEYHAKQKQLTNSMQPTMTRSCA